MHETQGILLDLPAGSSETLSKKGFAERVGVSPGRISQLIKAGLPVQPSGRIALKVGLTWYAANVDSNRSRAALTDPDGRFIPSSSSRSRRDAADADIAEAKAAKIIGALVDRKAVLGAIEARSRTERDAWLAFTNRAAAQLAAATGADARVLLAKLDELIREQLDSLSKVKIERLER